MNTFNNAPFDWAISPLSHIFPQGNKTFTRNYF